MTPVSKGDDMLYTCVAVDVGTTLGKSRGGDDATTVLGRDSGTAATVPELAAG